MRSTRPRKTCLDCGWMKHSRGDYNRGKCLFKGHSITYVNNYDCCNDWERNADEMEDDDYDDGIDDLSL